MTPCLTISLNPSAPTTRREFLLKSGNGLGAAALELTAGAGDASAAISSAFPTYPAKAKRVIYLFFSGGPSHIDMYDYKPAMKQFHGTELPESIRNGQRLTGMTSGQKVVPLRRADVRVQKHGQHGTYISELLPHTASIADDITIIKSMNTEAINHDPPSPSSTPACSNRASRAWARGSATGSAVTTPTCRPTS